MRKKLVSDLAEDLRKQIAGTIALYEKATGQKYHQAEPPAEAPTAARRRRLRPKYVPQNILPKEHTCPHCGETKNVAEEFGIRTVRIPPSKSNAGGTVLRYNSWCRVCRNSSEAHPTRARYGR